MEDNPFDDVGTLISIFAFVLAAFAIISVMQSFKESPNDSDMSRAARLPRWRKLLVAVVPAGYLFYRVWWMPEVGDQDFFEFVFAELAFYDPIIYFVLVLLSLVVGAELTGGRSAVLALQGTLQMLVGAVMALIMSYGFYAAYIVFNLSVNPS